MAEGLFSGMKFTDLFLPALAAGASAYNPHVGRGLHTGMNLFNSMADFQNNMKRFKQQQLEWDQLQEDRTRGLEAAGGYAGFVDKQVSEREEAERKAIIAAMDGNTTFGQYGPEGPAIASVEEPMSPEDAKKRFSEVATTIAPSEFDVFGGTQLPGPTLEEQFAEDAAPPMSEAMPWLVDERVQEALAGDPDYKALLERQATANLMGGTMGLSPGASIATLGNLAQGATSGQQERARMLQVSKDLEMQRENQFLRDSMSRDDQLANALALQDKITGEKAIRQNQWAEIATSITATGDVNNMKPLEAQAEVRRLVGEIARLQQFYNPEDETSVRVMAIAVQRLEQAKLMAERAGQGLTIGGAETETSTGLEDTAGDQKVIKDAQARLDAILNG